jgi:DNA mismatch repair protein MutS
LLGDGERRWIAAALGRSDQTAVAFLEVASGDFGGGSFTSPAGARDLLAQLRPRELLVPEGGGSLGPVWPADLPEPVLTERPAAWFEGSRAERTMREVLGVGSLRAFELEPGEPLVGAAGALLEYLRSTQGALPRHLRRFARRRAGHELVLDAATVRNLELLRDASGDRRAALATTLDHTVTPMGSRLLRDWLVRPLADAAAIEARHGAVAVLADEPALLGSTRDQLRPGDLERIAARLGFRQARPGELAALRSALAVLPELRAEVASSPSALLAQLAGEVDILDDLAGDLITVLADEPPAVPGPGMIRRGCDDALDQARSLAHGAKEVLGELEARERAHTGIANLRVRYNRVFGYAFEVSRGNLERVPADWVRRQTLTNAERFVTSELEELERRIAGAEATADARERELFEALLERCAARAVRLAGTARALAAIDVLSSFADRARRHRYVRPALVAGARVALREARHPVVEALSREPFVPNDVELDAASRQIVILTGPNMGGRVPTCARWRSPW